MNNPRTNDPEELIRRALRGELSEQERQQFQQQLRSDAALRERFEDERALERLLERLPNAPVPSNFTSLVLQTARAQNPKDARARIPGRNWLRFTFARVAAGLAVVVAAGLIALQQYRQAEREELAQTVSAFTEVASVIGSESTPPTAVFQDFDAIQQLSLPAESELDLDLLFALQK